MMNKYSKRLVLIGLIKNKEKKNKGDMPCEMN